MIKINFLDGLSREWFFMSSSDFYASNAIHLQNNDEVYLVWVLQLCWILCTAKQSF